MLSNLAEESNSLQKEAKIMKKMGKDEELSHLMQQLPRFESRMKMVGTHKKLTQEISDFVGSKHFKIMSLIELEQTIISGLNESGQ
mmetsp:Transcript_11031/g.11118  ORF Transcript_11031/g.11118 Transcript_11031/m.11118 type:complete len:86 (+) Transcript_11031:558-815(+)